MDVEKKLELSLDDLIAKEGRGRGRGRGGSRGGMVGGGRGSGSGGRGGGGGGGGSAMDVDMTGGGYGPQRRSRGGGGRQSDRFSPYQNGVVRGSGGRGGRGGGRGGGFASQSQAHSFQNGVVPDRLLTSSVFVSNVPQCKAGDLRKHMASVGTVANVNMLYSSGGQFIGSAVVDYATFSDAKRAIGELNGTTFRGSTLAVRENNPDKDRTFHTAPMVAGGAPPALRGGRGGMGGPPGGMQRQFPAPHIYPAPAGPQNVNIGDRQVLISGIQGVVSWQDVKDAFKTAGEDYVWDDRHDGRGAGRHDGCSAVRAALSVDIRGDRMINMIRRIACLIRSVHK
mmetsp:Transcript_5600/g.13334  ORF Transcript_5600/g.13334 Transcript_5600/m.13334 type:complete len:339 (-) Transcript_5600:28-1044(-)